mmetsp:Transcript_47439/g.136001  ORF Transcript_47439/g.136001 Transcript_47439/m.136001 type:complete len:142 (-) Transcript_47439:12-437(-)|eukprot:CAMPEP_0177206998 /NCGR_PEP_ID=MMETSP0367-20130122/29683_1 /TAXON_ID=447022 ORGANISM="Scrippsiella hangoei-like, Strain SHHI-4" /NCGR_SAMPLE_ID=MMETSP0367 /ASSEMBLY_ACC=CAM_ASM_000362 /LENGTH=141 /DNA_ID=CAMNT_0018655805 /DNA_START=35 /DNA_END=460 /DNA_ORIENTATION=+
MADLADEGTLVELMEEWLSGDDFDASWRECYDRACRGGGRSDRNISENVLYQTCAAVHGHLPAEGELKPLSSLIPSPDPEFIRGALEVIGADDVREAGIKDLEQLEAAVVVVYTQLAHCADILRKQMPDVAAHMERGSLPY